MLPIGAHCYFTNTPTSRAQPIWYKTSTWWLWLLPFHVADEIITVYVCKGLLYVTSPLQIGQLVDQDHVLSIFCMHVVHRLELLSLCHLSYMVYSPLLPVWWLCSYQKRETCVFNRQSPKPKILLKIREYSSGKLLATPYFTNWDWITLIIVGFTMSISIFAFIFCGEIENYTFLEALISTQ